MRREGAKEKVGKILVSDFSWLEEEGNDKEFKCQVRYRQEANDCFVEKGEKEGDVFVWFKKEESGLAVGQVGRETDEENGMLIEVDSF